MCGGGWHPAMDMVNGVKDVHLKNLENQVANGTRLKVYDYSYASLDAASRSK